MYQTYPCIFLWIEFTSKSIRRKIHSNYYMTIQMIIYVYFLTLMSQVTCLNNTRKCFYESLHNKLEEILLNQFSGKLFLFFYNIVKLIHEAWKFLYLTNAQNPHPTWLIWWIWRWTLSFFYNIVKLIHETWKFLYLTKAQNPHPTWLICHQNKTRNPILLSSN